MAEDRERARMGRPHIFVINGEPDILDVLRARFQRAEYNVTTTNFVPETFEQIAALRPAVLVLDLAVGERAGWALLERLRRGAKTRGIPVVVFSTDARLLARAEADPARYGGDAFLSKPFEIAEMLATVARLIGTA
jgi:two-component system, OmpR family, phosphate regulon response regulator PhoB